MPFLVFIILTFLWNSKLIGQTHLSLSEALNLGNTHNLSIQINEKQKHLALQDVKKSRRLFLPQISVSHTAIGTTNPLMAFGSKLNQEILTQQDFNPSLLNDPEFIRDYSTQISVKQPLINVDGIYERQAAKLNVNIQENQSTYNKKHIQLEIKNAYMQLQIALKQVRVFKHAKTTALAHLKYASDYFKQGYLQKSDLLDVEVHVQNVQNQLNHAKSQVLNASNYLAFLLNLKTQDQIIPTDDLVVNTLDVDSIYTIPLQREDLAALQLGETNQKQMLQSKKMRFLPRLNAFGNIELHDNKLFGTKAKGYLIGAQLSWDIFKGGEQWADVQKSKIELEKTTLYIEQYKQKGQLEINKTLRALSDANNQLILSNKSVIQSKEALNIRTNRFKQGLEKTTDLLTAETQYAQKQLEHLNTVYKYNYTLAYLQLLINKS